MLSYNLRAYGTRPMLARVVLLLACTASILALLLGMVGSSRAQAADDGPTPLAHTLTAALNATTDSSVVTHQPGLSLPVPRVLPFGVLTDSFQLVPGQVYPLIYSDTTHGAISTAILDFNGLGTTSIVMRAWIDCGYNPLIDVQHWDEWCPEDPTSEDAAGPTEYWLGNKSPLDGPYYAPSLVAGEGSKGMWLFGAPATPFSHICLWLRDVASMDHPQYIVPMADAEVPAGSHLFFHIRTLYTFRIQNAYALCNPPPGEPQRWYLEGVLLPDMFATAPALIDH